MATFGMRMTRRTDASGSFAKCAARQAIMLMSKPGELSRDT
jgi:hypothetical protein